MQYTIVHRDPQAFQQAVALEQIKAMCEQTFGQGTPINLVRELDGGQFNNTYLIELADRDPVILRVAPPPERAVFWHEQFLMRRELAMQPLLAPIAALLPTILMTDFTHEVIERDYLFQRWMPGSLWWDIQQDLTPEEHDDLWRQFGQLVRAISSVQGEAFGLVQNGSQFPTWSLTLLDWLERTITDAANSSLDTALLCRLLAIVRDHTGFLDEMRRPRRLARGFVVVQPADRAQQGGTAHRRGAGCRPWLVGRSFSGLDVLLAATPCLRSGTGALLAGLWTTGSRARGSVQNAGLSRTAPGQNLVGRQAGRERASGQ